MAREMMPGISDENREKFYSRVDRRGEDECWGWLGTTSKGNAYFFWRDLDTKEQRYVTPAHVLYVDEVGVPDEWFSFRLDSWCPTGRLCLNPAHKTATERVKRKKKTTCKRGHDLTQEGARISSGRCRECNREDQRNYAERVKENEPEKYEARKKQQVIAARSRPKQPKKSLNEQALELLNG